MKSIAIILTIVLSTFNTNPSEKTETENHNEITTYYLIRHAEKDRSNATERDPRLNDTGIQRAENWAQVFKDIPFDMVYSTNYKRTQATAQPTATSKGLEIHNYDPRAMYNETFQKETKGKTVLVVGHSNTTPEFANAILKENKYEHLSDSENGALFFLTVNLDGSVSSQVLYVN
ncbi:SixA phosphatase family protein [Gillisia marina]|uniref:SixA phosphatase family protein n=1 Tax=Gillisia marina TaxID=1167637 RepID=UPI00029A406F|nr:phosphoglycerate mutase family protein [Gillisia marina]